MDQSDPPVVLAVDDDDDVRTTYELWLNRDWEVRTASGGEEALEELDPAVDVVLLDRMMPGLSGRDVLAAIGDREADPQVVMMTAVDPGLDIVEMPFDSYVTKPVDRDELNDTVDTMLERREYDDRLQAYYALVEKRATLEAENTESALQDDERYHELGDRIEELEGELHAEMGDMDTAEFAALLDDVV
ncbi:response regulator [Halolamina litorea]|uniref:Response regulator transcription factor n=1 Tax=Halolamina litorea TaxID=1515593 RepID=A0ABD6BR51_9EURY|nr:HalX domain-containing protein [Halolamina litorea]